VCSQLHRLVCQSEATLRLDFARSTDAPRSITVASDGDDDQHSQVFRLVRDQIRQFQTDEIPVFSLVDPSASPDKRVLALAAEPVPCVTVVMGRHIVLLPVPTDLTFYDRLSALRADAKNNAAVFTGIKAIDWPRRPMHSLDLAPQALSQ
jgi:hypothetical protein